MRRLLLLFFTLTIVLTLGARRWTPGEVRNVIRKVNTYWQQNNKAEVRSFWDNAAYHTGNIEAYKLLGDEQMLDYSRQWAAHNQWMGATEPDPAKWKYKTYGEGHDFVLFGDWQICFQTYIDLFRIDNGQLKPGHDSQPFDAVPLSGLASQQQVKRALEVMDYEASSRVHDYWWWAVALYMVMPVMTKMYRLTGD